MQSFMFATSLLGERWIERAKGDASKKKQTGFRNSSVRLTLFVVFGIVAASEGAYADTIFSESFTGRQLFYDQRVSFLQTRLPSVSGDSMLFGPGNEFSEHLFVLPLVRENMLSATSPVIVSIELNLTRRAGLDPWPEDHDPGIGISDGVSHIGFVTADNLAGSMAAAYWQYPGEMPELDEGDELFRNAGYPDIGQSFTVHATMKYLDSSTVVSGGFFEASGTASQPVSLQRNAALSLIFFGHSPPEQYQINTLSVEVEGTVVPEPSSMVAFASLSLTGIGIAAWKRRRKN